MQSPIEFLISPLGCLILHSVIFIFSCIILVMWFSGVVVNPWSPVLLYLCTSTFCLIITIKQYQRAGTIEDALKKPDDDDDDDDDVTGGNGLGGIRRGIGGISKLATRVPDISHRK